MSAQPITVAIVEDDDGLRTSLKSMLRKSPDIRCVGDFPSAEAALPALATLRPAVVLMDINLPGMTGVECVVRCTAASPATQCLMLTVYDRDDTIFESLAGGASGYLLKPVRAEQLITAIREVVAGGAPMSPSIARRVVQTFARPAPSAVGNASLSPRESEILDLLAKGHLLKEIADQLRISYWTVQTHIKSTYEKLHVRSRAQAVAKYLGRLPG